MITPDGTGAENATRRRRPAPLMALAALIVFGGLVAIGVLSGPDQPNMVPVTTSTTSNPEEVESPIDVENFTVAQIETGDPLEWGLSMAIDDHRPLALIEDGGALYLFANSAGADPVGLSAWRSDDGTNWEKLGEVIPADHEVTTVDSTAQGLVATSTRLEDNALVVWESDDAVEWSSSDIAADAEDPYSVDVASAVGANEATLLVAADTRYDRERLLEERLREIGVEIDLSGLAWNLRWLGKGGHQLIVRGPLGIEVLEQPIDDLNLSRDEREELLSELFDPLGTRIWARSQDREWRVASIGDARNIESIVPTPDGRLIAYGLGASGSIAKVTSDGLDWDHAASDVSPWRPQPWRERYVGAASAPDIMFSEDGESWRAAGLSDRFPDELGWDPAALGAGPAGVAMFVRGGRSLMTMPQPGAEELIAEDGSAFTLSIDGFGPHIFSNDGRHRWTFDADVSATDPVDIDLEAEEITLVDLDTGAAAATFTFTELERAEREHAMSILSYEPLGAFAFSADGGDWVIQDMDPVIGDDMMMWLLEVTDDRVVALVRNAGASLFGDGSPGFEVWSAPVP